MAGTALASDGGDAVVLARADTALTDMSDIDVWLILTRAGGEILLARVSDSGLGERRCYLPGGRPDAGEHPIAAVLRHVRQRAGLTVAESDVRLATIVYWHDARGVSRIGLFFAAEHDASTMGDPRITWPHDRATLKWSPRGMLPSATDPVCAAGVGLARRGVSCAVLGPDGAVTCETRADPQPRASLTI